MKETIHYCRGFAGVLSGLLLVQLVMIGCGGAFANSITPEEAKAIAKEAYVYGFPMVVNYKTMNLYTIDESSPEYKGPFNFLACEARVFTPADKAVVTPNADTPYCMFWGDVRSEPLVLTVPEMEADRFYQVQLVDLYTHNFAYVSTIATGNQAASYLIAGPKWQGEEPEGITAVIPCETGFLFSVIRTQLFDPEDLERVKDIQDGYVFQPLNAFLGEESPPIAPEIDFPVWKEGAQFDVGFFDFFDFMLSLVEPVPDEQALFDRFAKIGLGTDDPFDIDSFSPEMAAALAVGVQEGFADIEAFVAGFGNDPLASSKIFGTRQFLRGSAKKNFAQDDHYLIRTAAAHTGLYGNSGIEAIYPTYFTDGGGQPLDASKHAYQITFADGLLPPVKAFWSMTMYDGKTQLFIDNPLDRYLLNSAMIDQFQREQDGSIILYIRKDSPGKDKEANWLPAPGGPFYLVLRLYGPQTEALEGVWTPPLAVRID